jgi:hypothetical protein
MGLLTDSSWFWVAVALALNVIDTVFRVVVDRHSGRRAGAPGGRWS